MDSFIEKAKQYPEIPELNSEILHLFIDKIIVSEKEERYSHTTPQKVKIVYRDIGLMDLTDTTALAEKLKIA